MFPIYSSIIVVFPSLVWLLLSRVRRYHRYYETLRLPIVTYLVTYGFASRLLAVLLYFALLGQAIPNSQALFNHRANGYIPRSPLDLAGS